MKDKLPSIKILKLVTETIQYMIEKENKWGKTFSEMFDGYPIPIFYEKPISALIKIVEETYNDKEEEFGSQFSWWIFEADFGRNLKFADSVVDKKGNKIPMRTVEDLYNYYKKFTLNEKLNKKNKSKKDNKNNEMIFTDFSDFIESCKKMKKN